MIIGISGRIGSGKDTVGQIIQYLTSGSKDKFESWCLCHLKSDKKWQIKKLADKLKECAAIIFDIPRKDFESIDVKNSLIGDDWGDITYRKFLQLFGTGVGRSIHENFWVNALFSDYKPIDRRTQQDPDDSNITYPNWIITDVRFPNELKAIMDRGGITIRMDRNSGMPSDHCSETALDNAIFDYHIHNSSTTIDRLISIVKDILIMEHIIIKD